MHISIIKNRLDVFGAILIGFLVILAIACGGGGEDSDEDSEPAANVRQTDGWEGYNIVALDQGAPINPNVIARVDDQGQVHIFYYTEGDLYYPDDGDVGQVRYQIQHVVWDPDSAELVGEAGTVDLQAPNSASTGDSGLNNCQLLDADFTADGIPVVGYQGGDIPNFDSGLVCNVVSQADFMVNFYDNDSWDEYLGIQGDASPKNSVFTDGYVGLAGSFAIDSENNVHMAAQHYYEFCDWTSVHYPDLLYVRQSQSDLGNYTVSMEEHVDEYNTYVSGGGIQSSMGDSAKLVLDQNEQPLIFYVGTPTESGVGGEHYTLRMADQSSGQWEPEVIEYLDEWELETLSPAVASDGTVAVAYYVENVSADENEPDHLRYAVKQSDGTWSVTAVDKSSHCGNYCSLAFDSNHRPAIAYYDLHANTGSYRERKNLKFARFNGATWQTETVSTSGIVGQYNSLWFDENDVAYICTYEYNDKQVIIFREVVE